MRRYLLNYFTTISLKYVSKYLSRNRRQLCNRSRGNTSNDDQRMFSVPLLATSHHDMTENKPLHQRLIAKTVLTTHTHKPTNMNKGT